MKMAANLILVLFLISCKEPTEVLPEHEELPGYEESIDEIIQSKDSLNNLYLTDASIIEFNELIKDSIKMYEQIELSESSILSFYKDLLLIHENSDKVNDSFFEHSDIHTYGAPVMYQINVAVDSNLVWGKNWKNGESHTGIPEIDAIMTKYNLSVLYRRTYSNLDVFKIISKKALNYYALIEILKKTHKFTYVEQSGGIGSRNIISLLKVENEYRYYKYSLLWGDCPAGCMNGHYWVIKIKGNDLELYEEWGDPLSWISY